MKTCHTVFIIEDKQVAEGCIHLPPPKTVDVRDNLSILAYIMRELHIEESAEELEASGRDYEYEIEL